MFAYCKNNPVNMSDPDGDRPIVSDDKGNLVLGYSSTEGHHHSSNTSVYSSTCKLATLPAGKKEATIVKRLSLSVQARYSQVSTEEYLTVADARARARSLDVPDWVSWASGIAGF